MIPEMYIYSLHCLVDSCVGAWHGNRFKQAGHIYWTPESWCVYMYFVMYRGHLGRVSLKCRGLRHDTIAYYSVLFRTLPGWFFPGIMHAIPKLVWGNACIFFRTNATLWIWFFALSKIALASWRVMRRFSEARPWAKTVSIYRYSLVANKGFFR